MNLLGAEKAGGNVELHAQAIARRAAPEEEEDWRLVNATTWRGAAGGVGRSWKD